MSEKIVFPLFNFLRGEVTEEKLLEAKNKAFPVEVNLNEGKLPADPSQIKNPEGDIRKLSEKDSAAGDVKPAEITADPKETSVEKEAIKETPEVNKIPQAEDGHLTKQGKADESKIDEEFVFEDDAELDALTEQQLAEKDGQWMQKAFSKHKGALHKALGVAEDGKIPVDKMRSALHSKNAKLRKRAQAAVNANPDAYGSIKSEGKLPVDPSQVKDPVGDVHKLAEETERPFTEVASEDVAKAISEKFPGSRYEQNQAGSWTVYVKEAKAIEAKDKQDIKSEETNKKEEKKEEKAELKECTSCKASPCTCPPKKDVKEDVSVSVNADGSSVDVNTTSTGTITMSATPTAAGTPLAPEPVVGGEVENQPEFDDAMATEMAEKLLVVEFLSSRKQLTEKQQKFVKEVQEAKLSIKNKAKVDEKLAKLRQPAAK